MAVQLDRASWIRVIASTATPRWQLVDFKYENENESGGRHNLYFTVVDENGAPLSGVKVWQEWPDGRASETTRNGIADFGLYGGPFYPDQGQVGAYSGYVADRSQSDVVTGMGLPANRHVNYLLTFQRVVSAPAPPTPPAPPGGRQKFRIYLTGGTLEGEIEIL